MYRPKSLKITNIISHTDSTYLFRKGEAVIIVGENLDNPQQPRNGSGKSAFIESLALAFAGTSIRDVRTKELITNSQDSGEVDLLLENTVTNKDLRIWRKIYSNTKAGECRVWIGEGENSEIKKSDINEYNKFIFEAIGLSKEDFFNFFLITSDNYNPFLKVSDTKKKEIINRFSGADNIDSVFPFIKTDLDKLEADKVQLGKAKTAAQTKAQLYAEELMKIEAQFTPEAVEEKLEAQRVAIDYQIQSIVKLQEESIEPKKLELKTLEINLKAADQVIEEYGKESKLKTVAGKDKVKEEEKTILILEKGKLNEKHANVQNSFKTRVDTVKSTETKIQTDLTQAKIELKEFEDFESEVSKKLEDSIECPNCKHNFSLRDKEFNVTEAKTLLPGVIEEIKTGKTKIAILDTQLNGDIPRQKQQINADILKAQESVKIEIQEIGKKLEEVQSRIYEINREKEAIEREYSGLLNNKVSIERKIGNEKISLSALETSLQTKNNDLIDLQNKLGEITKESGQEKVDELTKKIEDAFEEEGEIDKKLNTLEKEIEAVKVWEINFKNFKSHVANQSIKNVADYTNLFLQSMGTDLSINIEGYKLLSTGKMKEKIDTTVLRGGFDAGSYGKFSGGERGRIDICVIMANQELINLNCAHGKGIDLLVADEILDQVDVMGLESIIDALQSVGKTVAIVSQNEINALKEYTVIMRKQNGVTTIIQ